MLTRRLVSQLSNRKVQLQEHIYINSIHQVLNHRKGYFIHSFANVYMYLLCISHSSFSVYQCLKPIIHSFYRLFSVSALFSNVSVHPQSKVFASRALTSTIGS